VNGGSSRAVLGSFKAPAAAPCPVEGESYSRRAAREVGRRTKGPTRWSTVSCGVQALVDSRFASGGRLGEVVPELSTTMDDVGCGSAGQRKRAGGSGPGFQAEMVADHGSNRQKIAGPECVQWKMKKPGLPVRIVG